MERSTRATLRSARRRNDFEKLATSGKGCGPRSPRTWKWFSRSTRSSGDPADARDERDGRKQAERCAAVRRGPELRTVGDRTRIERAVRPAVGLAVHRLPEIVRTVRFFASTHLL